MVNIQDITFAQLLRNLIICKIVMLLSDMCFNSQCIFSQRFSTWGMPGPKYLVSDVTITINGILFFKL